ncbi:MAG: helix-turn-helix domain-containing protein [Sellimonas intestinalis]
MPYIGTRISDLLAQAGIPAETFADAVEITAEEAKDILNGSVTPNIGTLARISRFLNTSIDFLIGAIPYPTIVSSEDEKDIILYYRTMSKVGRRLLMGALEDFKDK